MDIVFEGLNEGAESIFWKFDRRWAQFSTNSTLGEWPQSATKRTKRTSRRTFIELISIFCLDYDEQWRRDHLQGGGWSREA